MLDTLAGLFVGLFFVSVAVKGNTTKMIDLAKRDKAFLQWAIAVGILLYLRGMSGVSDVVKWIIAAAFLGLLLGNQENIGKNVKLFWSQIGGT